MLEKLIPMHCISCLKFEKNCIWKFNFELGQAGVKVFAAWHELISKLFDPAQADRTLDEVQLRTVWWE